jgi:ATP-dependent Lon protease
MATALVSALTKKPFNREIAMTGEITLRGRVLPIGGLKEKLLAAHRGGIKKVVIPKENERDLLEIPKNILSELEVIPVDHVDNVLLHALIWDEDDALEHKLKTSPAATLALNVQNNNNRTTPPFHH